MNITVNNQRETVPSEVVTINDLIEWKKLDSKALAVVMDMKIVKRQDWKDTKLTENCNVTLFSAAFGG